MVLLSKIFKFGFIYKIIFTNLGSGEENVNARNRTISFYIVVYFFTNIKKTSRRRENCENEKSMTANLLEIGSNITYSNFITLIKSEIDFAKTIIM